jgi:hypothetical protein
MARAPTPKLVLAIALFISPAATTTLHPEVVVTTPADPIHLPSRLPGAVPLDVDGDGLMDCYFSQVPHSELVLEPTFGGRIIVTTVYVSEYGHDASRPGPTPMQMSFPGTVTPLGSGAEIGPTLVDGLQWAGATPLSYCQFTLDRGFVCYGEFRRLGAYIGIEFRIQGWPHYGWIRFDHFDLSPGGSILEWAFESQPCRPIKTPDKPVVVPMAAPKLARAGYLRLKWPSKVGRAYQVQAKKRMDALTWTNLSFVIAATASDTLLDLPVTAPAQFFRVLQLETQTPAPADRYELCDVLPPPQHE